MTDSLKTSQIKYRGKLPLSSYYELESNNRILINSTNIQTSPIRSQSPQQHQQQQAEPIVNTNLYVRSCVFSPDGTHLAWTCGYGLVKIMKWKESSTRKRTISVETSAYNPPASPTKIKKEQNDSLLTTPVVTNENNANAILQTPSCILAPPSLFNSPYEQTINNIDEIAEIDCGELVWSLAFGSTTSFVKHRRELHKQSRVNTRFDFGKQNLILAVGLNSGKIRIYNGINGTFLLCLFDHEDILNDLKFTKDGSLQLASVSSDQMIKLWNLYDDGNMYKTLKGHIGKINSCDWSPTASLLCSVGINRQVFIWDTETFVVKHNLRGHLHDVVTCEFSPDGCIVATGSHDTKICLWDPYNGTLIRQFCHMLPQPRFIYASGYNDAFIRSLAFSKGGDHLVSVCDDK